jgi:hypothetical protein
MTSPTLGRLFEGSVMSSRGFALTVVLALPLMARADEPPTSRESAAVDTAVQHALTYLQRAQDVDGAWRAGTGKSAGVSALCVMAFLSAGHTPGEGEFAETVEKGVRWVLKAQQPNGVISTDGTYEMYHHGMCTLMLAEVAGMCQGRLGEEVRAKLVDAVKVILRAQRTDSSNRGGWRYRVFGSDADISVTGWQLLALRAAKNLGCDVPPAAIDRAVDYLLRCYDERRGTFAYLPRGQLTVPCAGTGILGLELCGKKLHRAPQSLRAGAYVMDNPPRLEQQHCFYGLYYCSQAMFQLGDEFWTAYRARLHRVLLPSQSLSGAWVGRDGEARMAGPNYSTAMGVLALTVEYRFLPIYQRGEEPSDDKNK